MTTEQAAILEYVAEHGKLVLRRADAAGPAKGRGSETADRGTGHVGSSRQLVAERLDALIVPDGAGGEHELATNRHPRDKWVDAANGLPGAFEIPVDGRSCRA